VIGLVRLQVYAILLLTMTGWFFLMVRWRDFRIGLMWLPDPEKIFLLIGAALMVGCFFVSSSNIYRGIHLLFTLPGLLVMACDNRAVRQVMVQGCLLVVALAWAPFFLTFRGFFPQILASWIGNAYGVRVLQFLWLLSEIAWWPVATLFIAILIGCCANWFETVPEWRRLLRRVAVGQGLIPRPDASHD